MKMNHYLQSMSNCNVRVDHSNVSVVIWTNGVSFHKAFGTSACNSRNTLGKQNGKANPSKETVSKGFRIS